ncbi:2-C-methyl-D-erythritol 2,4-cyclodiphosphate synthase [Candidatus Vallotia tarda]|uniref:2-C-methyl-D-erythritol 2,4-cyclodiphosphate synthase n=1 Tax=Candidatus Vallotiella hemipterorum TaxID=1177213 RepID=A0A916JVJ6_9BURK|nr:2-C-methyl-D-erythritol 2,4-cyclodiphosphate synthase [Candidatus Vallotia tarda]CAG7601887.1 2-C-methyl-D-erythritol 2,4-cyclodiphosphate synthase [Candidatus Vallotia tarda]
MNLRIGQGYDVHRLILRRPLVLGGVMVPYKYGLLGYSDADVLLHAIIDALLGGAALGDIGRHFPDTDPKFLGSNSRILLREAARRVAQAGYRIVNVDSTIIAQHPKMSQYIPSMRENIAIDLNVNDDAVNIKAKTNENLGYLGRGKAIEAQAIALLIATGA